MEVGKKQRFSLIDFFRGRSLHSELNKLVKYGKGKGFLIDEEANFLLDKFGNRLKIASRNLSMFNSKLLLGSLVLASSLLGEVTTFLPYGANIDYTNDSAKSAKKDGTITGLYFSYGNLSYLLELDASHTNIKYKDGTTSNLKQDDFIFAYSGYYPTWKYKIGFHHVDTTDKDLGDGDVLITELGGYQTFQYDKLSYGLEGYYSKYKDAYDESGVQKKIEIYQLTPYVGFSKAIDINTRNNIKLKVNYISASDYKKDNYTSYEIEDTLYYKKFYTTLKIYGGKMKSGVKDSGHTVYNTKDLLKDGYSLKVGYFIDKNFTVSASYAKNNFEEYGKTGEASNDIAVATLIYKY
jgi:hypothetical protein